MILISLATIAFLLADSSFEELAPYSVWLRFVGVAIVAVPILVPHHRRSPSELDRTLVRTILGVSLGYVIFLAASTLPHQMEGAFLARLLAVGLIVSLISLLQRFYSSDQIVAGLQLGLVAVVIASLLEGYLSPSIAFEHDRLRGVLENANLLGFAAAALVVVATTRRVRIGMTIVVVPLGLYALVASASRASLVLLVICTAGFAIASVRQARQLLAIGLGLTLVCLVFAPGMLEGQYLFRSENTREVGIDEALRVLASNPFFGVGYQGDLSAVPLAGSPVAAAVQGGFIGLLGLAISYACMLNGGFRIGRLAAVVSVGLVVHSLFESWMTALGGPMALVGLLTWTAFARTQDGDSPQDTFLRAAHASTSVTRRGQGGQIACKSAGRVNKLHATRTRLTRYR